MRHCVPVALAALLAAVGCNRRAAPPPETPPPTVTVSHPLVKTVSEFTDLTGTLAPVQAAEVRPRVSGYIQRVYVHRGGGPPYHGPTVQTYAVLLGPAAIEAPVPLREGDAVWAGAKLVQIDPTPYRVALRQAEGELLKAQAQLAQATTTLARVEKLGPTASQEELSQATAQKQVSAATVESAAAAVETARLNLEWTTVRSPIDGKLDRIYVTEGNMVTGGNGQGTVLTSVVSMDPIYAYFDMDEATVQYYLRLIAEGRFRSMREQRIDAWVKLRGDEREEKKERWYKGYLDFVSNRLNPATGSLQIRGEFANPGPPWAMIPGMYVKGRIPLITRPDAVLVPDEAITTDQARKVVYAVIQDKDKQDPGKTVWRVTAKPVELGPVAEGLRVIESGLSPQERVIVHGLIKVQPGSVVDPREEPIKPRPGVAGEVGVPGGQSSSNRPGAPSGGSDGGQPGATPTVPGQSAEQNRPSGAPMGPATSSGKK